MPVRPTSGGGSGARVPVPRVRVAAGAGIVVLVVAAIIGLADGLRRPTLGGEAIPADAPDADPRVVVACPEPVPREGVAREEPVTGSPEEAVAVSSNDLHDCPGSYDGRMVRYQGEAVGSALPRGGAAWVQLNDDVYAGLADRPPAHQVHRGGNAGVGVLVSRDLADQIALFGGPGSQGDLLEVTGVFHRVDPRTREVAVIRADAGEIVRAGRAVTQPRLVDRRIAAVLLGLVAAAVVVTERVAARRR